MTMNIWLSNEASVHVNGQVRIEPRRPLPPVNFREWDGLLRLAFLRKNKTLGAIFRQASTLALLERNFEVQQALSTAQAAAAPVQECDDVMGMAVEDRQAEGDEDVLSQADDMDLDGGLARKKGRKHPVSEGFKQKVVALLEGSNFDQRRAAKLTQEDFMSLLAMFNQAGIHFA